MLKQYLQFKLSQKLSPQQIQLMKLIQLPTQAFEQRLKQELEENPALETGKEERVDDFEDNFDNSQEDYEDNDKIEAEDINIENQTRSTPNIFDALTPVPERTNII